VNLVVGATGALGGRITRDLLAAGEEVRVLVRPGSDYGSLIEQGAQPSMGDLKDAESLRRACGGARTLITTANSASRGGADTVDTVDLAGNRALIDAARDAGVEHFIFISALGASEQSPVPFLRAKASTEAHLRDSGLTWTILQPNLFMDVWVVNMVVGPVQRGTPVTLVGRGDHRHAMIAAKDVAAFAIAAKRVPEARNATLPLGGPEAKSWTQIVELAQSVIGRPIELQYVPPGTPLPGWPEVASQLATAFETYETVFDTSPLAERWGVRLTSLEEFLAENLRSISS